MQALKLNIYEFSMLLLPGCVFLYGLSLLYPIFGFDIQNNNNLSIGNLGLFLILSYILGHLIQGLGNIIEWIYGKTFGGPTDWIRSGKGYILSEVQIKNLNKQLMQKLGLSFANKSADIRKFDRKTWGSITLQIYAAVRHAKANERVEIFNSNYGLFRGLSVSLILLAITVYIRFGARQLIVSAILIGLTIISLYRMHRFSKHYARELFTQFLQI